MTKDRLADLRQASGTTVVVDAVDGHVDFVDGGETVALSVHENSSLSVRDDFFKQVQAIDFQLRDITDKVSEVQTIHNTIISAPVADETSKQKLDDVMEDIKRMSAAIQLKLKEMERTNGEFERKSPMCADTRIRKYQHSTLVSRFVEIMRDYQGQQETYRTSCRERIQRQLKITGQTMSDEELEDKLEKGDFSVFTQRIIIEKQEARQMWREIEDRHSDIMKLESSLKELHDMFVDIAMLVHGQGEIIDRIEDEVQRTVDFVDSGNTQLSEAGKKKRKHRKMKICFATCIGAAVIVIILIVVLSLLLS